MRYESTSHARDVADEVTYKRREAMHKMVASITHRKRPFVHTSHTVQGATCERQRWTYDTPTTTSIDRLRVKRQEEAKHKGSVCAGFTTGTNIRECHPATGSPHILVMSQLRAFIHTTDTTYRVIPQVSYLMCTISCVCVTRHHIEQKRARAHTFVSKNKLNNTNRGN